MDIFTFALFSLASVLYSENTEFFERAIKEMGQGAEWHYVGRQPLDPTALAIPGRICDDITGKCSEPYIMWKLKMPEK